MSLLERHLRESPRSADWGGRTRFWATNAGEGDTAGGF